MHEHYQVGAFELVIDGRRSSAGLTRDAAVVAIQPKPLALLVRLVRETGQLVSTETLQAELWPGIAVTEHSLRQLVLKLRTLLADAGVQIETVPRRGLRLVGEVHRRLPPSALPACPVPAPRGELIGRTDALAALDALLLRDRLVKVTGPGGVGKTSLVLQYVHNHQARWPGGVQFVDCSEVRTADEASSCLSRAFGLADRLVILDTFEPDVPVCVAPSPHVQVVVTSRHRLAGALVLGPLDPVDAAQLFLQRARAANQADGQADRAAIHALVAWLGFLPLAIELAAARVRVLPPAALLERLRAGEEGLLTRSSSATPRHRSLRASFDWSWCRLDAGEQAALVTLCTLPEPVPAALVDQTFRERALRLVDKGLVVEDDHAFTIPAGVRAAVRAAASVCQQQVGEVGHVGKDGGTS